MEIELRQRLVGDDTHLRIQRLGVRRSSSRIVPMAKKFEIREREESLASFFDVISTLSKCCFSIFTSKQFDRDWLVSGFSNWDVCIVNCNGTSLLLDQLTSKHFSDWGLVFPSTEMFAFGLHHSTPAAQTVHTPWLSSVCLVFSLVFSLESYCVFSLVFSL